MGLYFVAGLSTTLNSSVTKTIIRNMEMNGSLESSSVGLQAQGGRESKEDEDEETTRKGITLQRF